MLLGDTNRKGVNTVALHVPVKDIIIHNSFDYYTMNADIALMFLYHPVNFTPWVQPVCLPSKEFEMKTTSMCWMTGWGTFKKDGESGSRKLLEEDWEDAMGWPEG